MAKSGSRKSKKTSRKIRRRRPSPGRSSYTVNQLSTSKHKTIRTWITDIESHAAEIDALKTPSNFWGFEIFGYKSYRLYSGIDSVAATLRAYKIAEEHPKDAIKGIKVIKVEGVNAAKQWQKQKLTEVQDRALIKKLKGQKYRKEKRASEKKLKSAKDQLTKLRKKTKEKISKLQKQLRKEKQKNKRKRGR